MSIPSTRTHARPAYIITGPTSGIGHRTALELAKHGTLLLVGRNPKELAEVKQELEQRGQQAVSVICDLSEPTSIRRAVAEIAALKLPLAGVINNAGMRQEQATKNSLGWDMTFATNYLGTFLFTELLRPHLPDGATIVNVASAVEDPERKPAVMAGFRGGRFISVEAGAHGEWEPGGSTSPGFDSYATSKQAILASTLAIARENSRLRINAIEPGFIANTGLSRDANVVLRVMVSVLTPLLALVVPHASTTKRAARLATQAVLNASGQTGIYLDEGGTPMHPSKQTRDPTFQDRVVGETRAFLAQLPA
ncbi:MAG: hypothetical protein NVS2B7_03860 [Herpetosiphon sp.]